MGSDDIDDIEEGRRLTEPLISDKSTVTVDTDDDEDDDIDADIISYDGVEQTPMKVDLPFVATLILVIVGVACQAAAIVSAAGVSAASSIAVYVAGGVCIVNSPWVAVKQYRIAKNRGTFVKHEIITLPIMF